MSQLSTWNKIAIITAILAFIITLFWFLTKWIGLSSIYAGIIVGIFIFILLIVFCKSVREWFIRILRNPIARSIVLLAVFSGVVFLVLALLQVINIVDNKTYITIIPQYGWVYNDSEDHPEAYPQGGWIEATGGIEPIASLINVNSYWIHLCYERVKAEQVTIYENSGAYLLFYDSPIDISVYGMLSLSIKRIDETSQEIDLGVRLVVDNPNIEKDREVVIRNLPSLKQVGCNIYRKWTQITIDLREFTLEPIYRSPLPAGMSADKINKIVFFVDNAIISKSSAGEVLIKDIYFEKGY